MLVHIMDQSEMQKGDGPIGLICAPTRELSQQIYLEAKKFGKVYNIRVACVFGGGNKYEQSKALKECPEIVVATPVSDVFVSCLPRLHVVFKWCLKVQIWAWQLIKGKFNFEITKFSLSQND